jgi:hypothetical protein
LSHIKELIAWRTHFHASGRRFTHNSSGQKKSIDSDHGIYRDSDAALVENNEK